MPGPNLTNAGKALCNPFKKETTASSMLGKVSDKAGKTLRGTIQGGAMLTGNAALRAGAGGLEEAVNEDLQTRIELARAHPNMSEEEREKQLDEARKLGFFYGALPGAATSVGGETIRAAKEGYSNVRNKVQENNYINKVKAGLNAAKETFTSKETDDIDTLYKNFTKVNTKQEEEEFSNKLDEAIKNDPKSYVDLLDRIGTDQDTGYANPSEVVTLLKKVKEGKLGEEGVEALNNARDRIRNKIINSDKNVIKQMLTPNENGEYSVEASLALLELNNPKKLIKKALKRDSLDSLKMEKCLEKKLLIY